MPWKEWRKMDERLRFVARLLDGEKMAPLCREFGISRKTGYKIFNRYRDTGLDGLTDRSRRPYRQANKPPMQIEKLIISIKKEFPAWGAPKIRERLRRIYPDLHCPEIRGLEWTLRGHSDPIGTARPPRDPRPRSGGGVRSGSSQRSARSSDRRLSRRPHDHPRTPMTRSAPSQPFLKARVMGIRLLQRPAALRP